MNAATNNKRLTRADFKAFAASQGITTGSPLIDVLDCAESLYEQRYPAPSDWSLSLDRWSDRCSRYAENVLDWYCPR